MAEVNYSPIKGEVLRLVRLDECGLPVTGAQGLIVTDGFIKVDFAPEYQDGKEHLVENAKGDLVVNERDPSRLKLIGVTITMAQVQPASHEMMLGFPIITDGGDGVGNFFTEEKNTTKFALELWADVAGQECIGGQPTYEHLALGWVENARLGNSTTENGPASIEITAQTHRAPNYGTGPFSILPEPMPAKGHMARYLTTVAPPEPAEGYQSLVLS